MFNPLARATPGETGEGRAGRAPMGGAEADAHAVSLVAKGFGDRHNGHNKVRVKASGRLTL